MRITDKTPPVLFRSLSNGDLFRDDGNDVMLKIVTNDDNENAARMSDGETYLYGDDQFVLPLDAELVIHGAKEK